MKEELWGSYACSVCGVENETSIDPSAGVRQSYVEDCSVCCRPNVLTIEIDEDSGSVSIEAEFEG
jgi:hypothetical protein